MATRLFSNLISDLKEFSVGDTLDIELFPHPDEDENAGVGRAIIERVKGRGKMFTLTTFDYGEYKEDEDGEPIENDPIENVSVPMNIDDLVGYIRNIGEFAY